MEEDSIIVYTCVYLCVAYLMTLRWRRETASNGWNTENNESTVIWKEANVALLEMNPGICLKVPRQTTRYWKKNNRSLLRYSIRYLSKTNGKFKPTFSVVRFIFQALEKTRNASKILVGNF
jgi:hypothetical protein